MRLFKKTVEGFLLAGIFFLLFLLVFEDRMHLPAWLQVIGRMHPMFLHFPITLLLVYFVVFWIPANESATLRVRVIGFIAAASAVITAVMGLLLSLQENFEGTTFQRHKWGGISIALIACIFYYLYPWFIRKKSIAR
ncbi:MAG: cytochrome C, partial [Chitinophagaceae bacterium]|nr:cytochrome C [Chitinophagaceae bacterium]